MAASPASLPGLGCEQNCRRHTGACDARRLSESDGEYAITDKTDVLHHLSGNTKLLKPLNGHEVQVTGTPSVRTVDTTLAGGASSVIEKPVFKVKTVTDVSATCQILAR